MTAAVSPSPTPPGASSMPRLRWPRSAGPPPGSPGPGCSTTVTTPALPREYLAATGYAGAGHYRDERAVIGGDLITAGPQSPVQFAGATLRRLGLVSDDTVKAYEAVMHRGDQSAYPALMAAVA